MLLWRDASVDGMKTGHTESAGFCLVTSAQRDGRRLVSVVLGTKSEKARADESLALINYGFRFYETHKLYGAGQPVTQTRIWKGASEKLPLGLARDLYITLPRGQYQQLKASMKLPAKLEAPVVKGQQLRHPAHRSGRQGVDGEAAGGAAGRRTRRLVAATGRFREDAHGVSGADLTDSRTI